MSLFLVSAPQFANTLSNLHRWLDIAVQNAAARSFDPEVLLTARLAPDQLPLLRQVQIACDTSKISCALVTGKTPPKHPDTEQSIADLKARIDSVHEYLGTFKEEDFAGCDARVLTPPALQGRSVKASDYLAQFSIPNFYFHATTAYAILRHNGVVLGKRDYIGRITLVE
jgi:hypothetical protein